tara:strand:+ start:182 stop:1027 length:846 start_codon:yes stop_codon:yes gene_type:complete
MSIQDITIVITSFRSDQKIINCLNSINNQCKVIVVENSNNSKFKERIEKEFNNIECVLAGENLGYGKANNIGLKKVKTKYALILNPDASLHSSTLENFFHTIKQAPEFAIIGPYLQKKMNNEDKMYESQNKLIEVKNIKGFAMFLNLSKFKEIGFFDENFFLYFEEIDLCKRIISSKNKIYLATDIKINHEGAQSHDETINNKMELSRNWHWMWSTFYYQKKYKGFLVAFFIVLPKLISAIFKIFIYKILRNREKREIYFHRYSGLINAIRGKTSWYRPKV